MKFNLSKKEILNGRTAIQNLFQKGKIFTVQHIKVFWLLLPENNDIPVQVLFSVPKKIHKTAIKRNVIKRRMREVYRLNKHELAQFIIEQNKGLHFAFIFTGTSEPTYGELEINIRKVLKILVEKCR